MTTVMMAAMNNVQESRLGQSGRPDQPVRPMARRVEKGLLIAAAGWNVFMASMTLFMYSPWFRKQGYATLESAGEISSMSLVNQVMSAVNVYAFAVLLVGVVSFLFAMLAVRPGTISKAVIGWMVFGLVFSLATGDWISLALYSVTLAVYMARNKAIRAQRG